jgi:hypothetical protein
MLNDTNVHLQIFLKAYDDENETNIKKPLFARTFQYMPHDSKKKILREIYE